jgi:hypothetical protein
MEGRDGRAAKWFTSARKFPQLIGRTPDGTQLPGGPYTITQLVVGGVVALLLWNTTGLWARFGLAGNIIVGPALVIGAVFAAGKIPFEMRSPVVVGSGWIHALSRSTTAISPVRLRPPHRPFGHPVLMVTGWPEAEPDLPAAEGRPAAASDLPGPSDPQSPSSLPALTGVQQLLAGARR